MSHYCGIDLHSNKGLTFVKVHEYAASDIANMQIMGIGES